MNKKHALTLARKWAQGGMCSIRDGEAREYHKIVVSLLEATPPNISSDLISRAALLVGETEPEITTGSDSELAEHMEWERWMDKIKRAPAVGKEEEP